MKDIYRTRKGCLGPLFQSITAQTFKGLIGLALVLSTIPGPSSLQVLFEPFKDNFPKPTILRRPLSLLIELFDRTPLSDIPKMHVHQVGRPLRQIVQDMRRIHDRARARLGLPLQEGKEVAPGQQVKIDGDLIQQQHLPGPNQTHRQLHTTSLTVRHGMHAPVEIDVENVDQFIPAVGISVSADRREESRDVDIRAYDVVENPFGAQVCHSVQTLLEGIFTSDGDGVVRGETLAG